MNIKKVFMIILLIIFIGAIGFVLVNVNKKSVDKINEISAKPDSSASEENVVNVEEESKSSGNVRKSTEKAQIDTKNMVEITDNFFIEQTNDVFINLNDYIGKTIKIEGLVYSYLDSNGDTCYAVVRNTPGCCGSDGLAGLDIRYDEDYPEVDTWVEVIGVVGKDTMYGSDIPAIQVSSMQIKEKGITFVTN